MSKKKIEWEYLFLIIISVILLIVRINGKQKEYNIIKLLNTIYEVDSAKIYFPKQQKYIPLSEDSVHNLTNIQLLSSTQKRIIKKHSGCNELFQILCYKDNDVLLTLTAIDVDELKNEVEHMEFKNHKFVLMYNNVIFITKDITSTSAGG